MKPETRDKLFEAWAYCDEEDKSTEFMLVYMADFAGVSEDCVLDFLASVTDKERIQWYKNRRKIK